MTPQEPRGGEGLTAEDAALNAASKVIDHTGRPIISRPTAPSASGGEAVAWQWRVPGLLTWNVSNAPDVALEGAEIRPLFTHPAMMPTRVQIEALIREHVFETGRKGDLAGVTDAANDILALFHTGETNELDATISRIKDLAGETRGDGRG